MEGRALVEDCKYFTVLSETKDFAVIRVNTEEEFNGKKIIGLSGRNLCEFVQFLMDEYGLAQVGSGGSSIVCRKVKE